MPFCAPCDRYFRNDRALQQHLENSSAHYDDSDQMESDDSYDSSEEESSGGPGYQTPSLFCARCQWVSSVPNSSSPLSSSKHL